MSIKPRTKPQVNLIRVEYWINWLAAGFASGKWNSMFLGRGFDFQGIAPFREDPDMVRINWNATLNSGETSGELQVSQFSEERNINIILLGDLSPSMAFGSQITKQDRLALLAAVISFSALWLKDTFKFIGYTDKVEPGFPETRGQSYPLLLAQSIMDFDWQKKRGNGLQNAVLDTPRRKSLVILVSDFQSNTAELEKTLSFLVHRHRVLPIVLWDEREVELPTGWGIYPIQDLETGEQCYIFLTEANRQRFAENASRRKQELEQLFSSFGLNAHFLISNQDDIISLLNIFLLQRHRT